MSVQTYSIFKWAAGTAIRGNVGPAEISTAAQQLQQAGKIQVWLLDVSGATGIDPSVLGALPQEIGKLQRNGLDRVAIVLPEIARAYLPMIQASVSVRILPFASGHEALAWIKGGCK